MDDLILSQLIDCWEKLCTAYLKMFFVASGFAIFGTFQCNT